MASATKILETLFPLGHSVAENNNVLVGSATMHGADVAIVGTTGRAPIDATIAITLAQAVIAEVDRGEKRAILFLVDTSGQAMLRSEETIGLNSYLAHLASCVDLARRAGHKTVSLVYGAAVSGGYLAFGLMADCAFALNTSQVEVMDLRAMARVTKIDADRLTNLAQRSPVFGPGPSSYWKLGAIDDLWPDASDDRLVQALSKWSLEFSVDTRSKLGMERGGRAQAQRVIDAVRQASC